MKKIFALAIGIAVMLGCSAAVFAAEDTELTGETGAVYEEQEAVIGENDADEVISTGPEPAETAEAAVSVETAVAEAAEEGEEEPAEETVEEDAGTTDGQNTTESETEEPAEIRSVTLKESSFTYRNGNPITQSSITVTGENGEVLLQDEDYTVEYSDNVNVGTASVTVTGIGNYTGTITETFSITKADITDAQLAYAEIPYRGGNAVTQTNATRVFCGTKTLTKGTDYKISYTDNTEMGTATMIIKGKGNYKGTITKTFVITQRSLAGCGKAVLEYTSRTYYRVAYKPAVTVTAKFGSSTAALVKGTDYTVSYKDNVNAGTATVTIKGKGNYKGTITKTFTIKQKALGSATLKYSSLVYNGAKRTQTNSTVVKAKLNGVQTVLTKGTDFTIKYKNNLDVGTAVMYITGKGNFKGTLKKTFKITRAPIGSAELSKTSYVYKAAEIRPAVTATAVLKGVNTTLEPGTDYSVTYKNNLNAGTATVIIKGTGNFTGRIKKTFTIKKRNIAGLTATCTHMNYTGKPREPHINIPCNGYWLVTGTDFTVTYKNNVEIGTGTAIIKGIGNFKGTKELDFEIKKMYGISSEDYDENTNIFSLSVGQKRKFYAFYSDYDDSSIVSHITIMTEVTWTSSNPEVAKVNSKGVVTAVSEGTTVLKGVLADGSVQITITVS